MFQVLTAAWLERETLKDLNTFQNKAKLKLSRRFTLFFFLTFPHISFLFPFLFSLHALPSLSFFPLCLSFLLSLQKLEDIAANGIAFALSQCVGIRKRETPYLIRRLLARKKKDPNKRTRSRIARAIREPFIITEMRRAASLGTVLPYQPG